MTRTATIELRSSDWDGKVLLSKIPVIVEFWAPWCPWCKRLMPVFEEVSERYQGRIVFAKLNVEQNQYLASSIGITGIPVMKIFHGGVQVEEIIGYVGKERLVQELDRMLETTLKLVEVTEK